MSDPWAQFRTQQSTLPAAQAGGADLWAAFRKQEAAAGIPPAQAEPFVAPDAPPGVNIHMGNGKNMLSKGGGQYVEQSAEEAKARAGREGGIGSDVGASMLRGVPFAGPFMDRAIAGGSAAIGGDYDKVLAEKRAQFKTFDEDYPKTSMAAKVGGGIAGMAAAAPLAAETPAAWLLGMGAKSLPGAMARGGVSGLAQGAASGVGRTENLSDPVETGKNAVLDALIGGGIGSAAPVVIGAAGKVVDGLRNRAADALSSVPAKAREWAVNALGDPARVQALRAEVDRLGPQAMLADASPEWMGVARGAASRPGSRDQVVNALLERDAGKNTRINGTINGEIGPAPVPSRIDAAIGESQRALGPEYGDAFRGASRVNTTGLADTLDTLAVDLRGPAQQAVRRVRDMLNVPGTHELDPNPSALFQTRQAIDGLMAGETNPQVVRHLTAARQQVDDTLARAVPGIKDVDAKFAELARQREGLQRGSQVLDGGKTTPRPVELAAEVQQGAIPQGNMVGPSAAPLRMREGARAEIDRIVGQNSNDISALNRLVKGEGDWNRDKLRTLFGADRADRILRVLDAEQVFQRTAGRVTAGSDTSMGNRFGDFLDDAAKPTKIDTASTMFGTLLRGGQKAVGAASQARAEDRAQQFAEALGRVSVAQGPERDAIVQALMSRSQRANSLQDLYGNAGAAGGASAAIVRALMGR